MDFVPNHMGIQGGHNPYWEDVLRHGQGSRYAHFFDISWHPLKRALEGKVLLPTLGDQYGRVLERGELKVELHGDEFFLCYWERKLPLSPRSLALLLGGILDGLPPRVDDLARAELASIARSVQNLPRSTDENLSDEDRLSRAQEADVIARRLGGLMETSKPICTAITSALQGINTDPVRLDALIAEQNYRLAYWKVGDEEINYRRFFDVGTLAAIRVEEPEVFDATHALVLRLLRDGVIDGLRIDHPDGLAEMRRDSAVRPPDSHGLPIRRSRPQRHRSSCAAAHAVHASLGARRGPSRPAPTYRQRSERR